MMKNSSMTLKKTKNIKSSSKKKKVITFILKEQQGRKNIIKN